MSRQEDIFGRLLRFWRAGFALSQEELAGRLEVSARHISFLENGRAAPSRSLVEKLAADLSLSRRDQGNLMLAAGYVPQFAASALTAPQNRLLHKGLVETLRHLDPCPAAVIDPCANVKMVNRAWVVFYSGLFGSEVAGHDINTIRLLVAKDGWRRYVTDWVPIACLYLVLLSQEAILRGNLEAAALVREVAAEPEIPDDWAKRGALMASEGPNHLSEIRSLHGSTRRLLNVHHTVGSTGYVSEPRLIIHVTFTEDGEADLSPRKLSEDIAHPLLAY